MVFLSEPLRAACSSASVVTVTGFSSFEPVTPAPNPKGAFRSYDDSPSVLTGSYVSAHAVTEHSMASSIMMMRVMDFFFICFNI